MIEAWLNVVFGGLWETIEAGYRDGFTWYVGPLAAWIVVAAAGRRAVHRTHRELRTAIRELGADGRHLDGDGLVLAVGGRVRSVAAQARLMPTPSRLWITRADTEALAAMAGLTPSLAEAVRDDVLRVPHASRRTMSV